MTPSYQGAFRGVNRTIPRRGVHLRWLVSLIAAGVLWSVLLPRAAAQDDGDRVLAVAGRQVFTAHDMDIWVFEARLLEGGLSHLTDEDLRRQLVPEAVDDFLLAGWGEMVLSPPPQEAVSAQAQARLERCALAAGGVTQLDARLSDAGITPEEFRRWLRDRARESLMIRDAIAAHANLEGRSPEDVEISEAWRIRLGHIFLRYRVADEAGREETRRRALQIRRDIEAGLPFPRAARLYSDDQSTAMNDGLLGWFSKEEIRPAFWQAALSARPGEVTSPVEGDGGLHLFLVVDFETPEQREYRRLMREEEHRQLRRLRRELGIVLADGYELMPLELADNEDDQDDSP